MMSDIGIAIVGGGLSGLCAAASLEAQGRHDYVLLEARDSFSGRIRSESFGSDRPSQSSMPSAARFDLGATWFWPDFQAELAHIIRDFSLPVFAQDEDGDMLIERSAAAPPACAPAYLSSPASMRIAGGMAALTDAMLARVNPGRRHARMEVNRIRRTDVGIEVGAIDRDGRSHRWSTKGVLLAVPPRLAIASIEFSPPLPEELTQQWRGTPTWMAPHAKYLAVYDRPFWRESGLSGAARSQAGPMVEIHDASHPGGPFALFGFIGVPATSRARISPGALQDACRQQFVRLFGAHAATPVAAYLKDWSTDSHTADVLDSPPSSGHARAPTSSPGHGAWKGRLVGIASEWSPEFPGYVAGAVDAARRGLEFLKAQAAETEIER